MTATAATEAAEAAEATAEPRRVLVLGASGYVGRHLVPELQARGHSVRAAARRLAPMEAEGWSGVELVRADALEPESLPHALAGVSVVYFLVHAMADHGDFPEKERRAAANVAAAAERAGVARIVYLGGLAPAAEPASRHLASRAVAGETLRGGGVPVTELRAPVIVGPGSVAFEVMRDLAAHLPVMITPRWVRAKSPPVALDDLLADLVALPEATPAESRVYETGGPQQLTYEAMLRTLARELGRSEPVILPVPFMTPELSSYWLAFVSATPTAVARALIGGLKHDLTADDRALRAAVPRRPMSFDAAVRRAFERERQIVATDRWREGAFNLRDERHDISFYGKRMTRAATARVDAETLWDTLREFGTRESGYFFLNGVWNLRRRIDEALGGHPEGRRRPGTEPEAGERFDMWEVLAARRPERLVLKIRAVVPGSGGLAFTLEPVAERRTRLSATMHWHPAGFVGLLYWYQLGPPHAVMLEGMLERICRRAEARTRRTAAANGHARAPAT